MTEERGYTLFDTAIGWCGIAWNERGVAGVELPDRSESATRERLRHRFPGVPDAAPPPGVARAIEAIAALLQGEASDLSGIALDLDPVAPFERGVYELARTIPPGETLTYGEVASRLGAAGAAQAVGRALARNPFPIVVPCHRVMAAGGKLGGFSAPGGSSTKRRLLAIEGTPGVQPTLFDEER